MSNITNIGWTLGNDCPCHCNHCYSMSVREKGKDLNKNIVDRIISQICTLNVETVNLGGNEPIFTNGLDISKSLLPYILMKLNNNNIKVGITTSGISLVALKSKYPESLKYINDVDISLDSPYQAEHNNNRGGDIFKHAISALEICNEYNLDHSIIMCAMKWNFKKDRVDGLIKLCKKYNANLRFNILKPVQPTLLKDVPSLEQFNSVYSYILKLCDTIDMSEPILAGSCNNKKIKGCSCGISSMRINSITPAGTIPVSPCVYMHDFRGGDILKDDLLDIVNSEQFKKFEIRNKNYKNIEGCSDCKKSDICRGGCFAMAYTYKKALTGKEDLYAKDPFCDKNFIIDNTCHKVNNRANFKRLVHENYLCTWIGKPR